MLVSDLSGGINNVSYDVAFGDFNNDELMDIVVVDADSGTTRNHLYLNDFNNPDPAAPRLLVSNEAEFNPAPGGPFGMLTAQPVDVDGDGDLDVILGAESRDPNREPLVIRNNLNATDAHPPQLEHPSLRLTPSNDPSAMFRLRIRDRSIDFDEIDAQFQWNTVGNSGGSASGNAPLNWGAQMTYQTELTCSDLHGGSFAQGEQISSLNWTVTAADSVASNISTLNSSDPGVANLLTQLQNSINGAGTSLNIIEPIGGGAAPIVNSDGSDVLLVRVILSPSNIVPNLDGFSVQINGDTATVLSVQKVGDQVWLAVQPPIGPNGVHDLQVDYRLCGLAPVSDTEFNAVAYDEDPSNLDTVLAIDLSGSMNSNDKLAAAINAGKLFINTLRDEDKLSQADNTGRMGAISALDGLSASGCTPLGAGLNQSLVELDNLGGLPANPLRSILLLSDGLENIQPFWNGPPLYTCSNALAGPNVSDTFNTLNTNADPADNVRVDTVALGPNASITLMTDIALATGGTPRQVLDTAGTVVANATSLPLPFYLIKSAHAQSGSGVLGLGNSLADVAMANSRC